ncbi:unnamed protein product [Brachionus calyciflorus]|uniref:ASD2 domain-containing protein n=1 Tax=Brachionus calyciflorus TaxID=104777 RepID=A0A813Q3K4_9BILA|nr:unnamed protein product [Brachionus calyciflorus]
MRNLYQSPSPNPSSTHHHHHHTHHNSYPNTSQIENNNHNLNTSLINHSSPKIIQVQNRNSQSPSACFINKQSFHQSPKIKSIFQANNFDQSVKSPILLNQNKPSKAHKLSSSSSISSTSSISFLNSTLSNNSESENNVRPSSILKNNKFSSPLVVSSSSSSSSTSSSPSPVLKNIQDQQQNDRFFDSNTLYKKELKQKQRDILSTSITSKNNSISYPSEQNSPQKVLTPQAQLQLQKLQQSIMKHEIERQISQIIDDENSHNLSRNSEKRSTLPHNLTSPTSSNNKVLNLFTNLLNRNKNEQNVNYSNLKNLKRATSSGQFSKSKLNETTNSTSPTSNESKTSLSSLFNNTNKIRRSLDDVARLNLPDNNNDTFISLDNKRFENTAFSTKNNGLIFLPQKDSYDNYENLDNLENLETGTHSPSLNSMYKPSDEILKRINSLTKKSTDESNAFDNNVYSYVDNIRQHSKRLSEINFLQSSSAIAAASAAAAAAVSSLNNKEQNSQSLINSNLNNLSCSSSNSSSISSFHNSNVMSLRDKFESFKQDNGPESPKMSIKSIKSDSLSVNTNLGNSNNKINNLNSPALSSVSSSSSRSSAISSSLSSGSFSKDLQIPIMETKSTRVTNRISFNFYYEFYRFNLTLEDGEDEISKKELDGMKHLNEKLFYINYEKILSAFIRHFDSSCIFLKNVLDPILADSLSTYSTNSSLFNFKFTIEFFRPILLSSKKLIQPICSTNLNTESYEMITNRSEPIIKDDNYTKQLNVNLYEFNLNSYSQLFNELSSKIFDTKSTIMDQKEFDLLKSKLILFTLYKLQYFNDELRLVQRAIELNDKLGQKILKELETESEISTMELEKYKLLVSESDVITNLLLKLCNKIAHTENSIQLLQLAYFSSNISAESDSNESINTNLSNEEIDLLKQELNQTHRKKEEALYLKNGIDKRAGIVTEFLLKYRTKEQLDEFEIFLGSKQVNALKQRHLKDHIELAQMQIKILNDLKLD